MGRSAAQEAKKVTSQEDDTNSEMFDIEPSTEIQDVGELQQHGISKQDIEKLRTAGICTIKGLQMCTRKRLINLKGLSEAKVDKMKEAIAKVAGERKFLTANEVSEKRKGVFKVSTGSEALDNILGGGIESMSITEAYGEFRCGKTQLSHTLCITCQVDKEGYTGGKVIFIDTENTFRPDRLRPIARRFGLDETDALENVLYVRAFTSDEQIEILDVAAAKMFEEPGAFKVLIVDSIMALFRVDYSGRGELSERQQKLAQMMSKLQKISEEYNVAVFITNQMTSDPGAMAFAPSMKPIGGNIMAHASTTRIYLRKGKGEGNRVAKIADSPDMPESEAGYSIHEGGICDSSEN